MYPSLSRSPREEKSWRQDEFVSDPVPAKPARRNESVQFAREMTVHRSVYSLEENSTSPGFRQHSSKMASGTPIKALINEDVSKEMENKHTTPSLVARLMGIDTLPARVADKHAKHVFQSKSINESQEYKDVFEVMEASKLKKHRNQSTRKEVMNYKRADTDIDFIRQKFMDAKRLSTDEAFQNSEELNDALEILDSNKNLLLEFLQDPNSLFTKHHHVSPSPVPKQITILKSSKSAKFSDPEAWTKLEGNHGKCSYKQKYAPSLVDYSLKDQNVSHGQKTSASGFVNNAETHSHATRIVILKTNLEKARKMAGTVSFVYKNPLFESRKQKGLMVSGTQELHKEGRERKKISTDLEYSDHKAKESREITRQMWENVTTCSKRANLSDLNSYFHSELSSSDFAKMNNSETFCQLPYFIDEWNNGLSSSSSCSVESSTNREARKRLSVVDSIRSKVSDVKFSKNEYLGTWGYPSYINSKHGWKDGNSRNIQRSNTLPSLSSASTILSKIKQSGGSNNYYMLKDALCMKPEKFPDGACNVQGRSLIQNSQYHPNKFKASHSTREDNMVPEREIHVHSEVPRKVAHVSHGSKAKPSLSVSIDEAVIDSKHIDAESISVWEHEKHPSTSPIEQVKQSFLVPLANEKWSGKNQNEVVIQETSIPCAQVDPILYQPEAADSCPSLCSKQCSALKSPSEKESSALGCFERISTGLQEVRIQLKLLNLDSEVKADESDINAYGEDCGVDCHSSLPGQIIQAFRNKDDRDFSYVLDMLIDSGIHGANQEWFPDCCKSPSYPVGQHAFQKLEKKYCTITSWSKSERKLLFDLTNFILSSMLMPCMDLHPWVHSWGHEGLVEGLWQRVVKLKEDVHNGADKILDSRWLSLKDDVQFIGKEIEIMLNDDLLEELLADFCSSVCKRYVAKTKGQA